MSRFRVYLLEIEDLGFVIKTLGWNLNKRRRRFLALEDALE